MLSSWMIRLAHGNGLKVQAFYADALKHESGIWNRDVDRCAHPELINHLAARVGRSVSDVERLTLRNCNGVFAEDVQPPQAPWVLSLGVYHRTRLRPGLMFCPLCLRADAEPYLRKAWRLACITCCTVHGCRLQDRCPTCGAFLQPHRIDMASRSALARGLSLAVCYRCRADLRRLGVVEAPSDVVEFQRRIEATLSQGFVDFAGNPSLHSLSFFGGIHHLASGLLRAKVRGARGVRVFPEHLKKWPLEWLALDDRLRVMAAVAENLADWPSRFLQSCLRFKHPYSTFRSDASTPYWFARVVQEHLRRTHLVVSDAEAAYIAEATAAVSGRFSIAQSRRLFRRDIGRYVRRVRQSIDRDDVEELVAGIDHAIAESTGWHRLDFLRDKAMFVTARVLGLHQHALAGISLDDMPPRHGGGLDRPSFANVPSRPDELAQWLRWYFAEIRPRYPSADHAREVFLCRGRRGRLSDSLVGTRFTLALSKSQMERRIHTYADWVRH